MTALQDALAFARSLSTEGLSHAIGAREATLDMNNAYNREYTDCLLAELRERAILTHAAITLWNTRNA